MPFNINEIRSAINSKEGLLSPAHFLVLITPSSAALKSKLLGIDEMRLFCDTAVIPGVNFKTTDIRMLGYGMTERRPTNSDYGTLNLSFFCDNKGSIYNLMHKWFQNVQNINSVTRGTVNSMQAYEYQYPETYEAGIELFNYDVQNRQVFKVAMFGCYPLAIQDTPLDWQTSDTIMKLNVQFSYNYWTSSAFDNGTVNPGGSPNSITNQETTTKITTGPAGFGVRV